jgi:glycosyltransferase involved in cell wall biosynthesis
MTPPNKRVALAIGAAFLTWEHHRRSEGLIREIGLQPLVLTSRRRGALRYLELIPRTIGALLRQRPRWVIVQCPSLMLALLTVLLRPLLRYKLGIDAHNEAVTPFVQDAAAVRCLTRWLHRQADLVIVTNEPLAATVLANAGTAFVLPDPLPPPASAASETFRSDVPLIAVISTYAPDEPLEAIVAAAGMMRRTAQLVITGNAQRGRARLGTLPSNIRLTGFLPEQDYWELLRAAGVVLDLTLMPHCLVCGAYEALAVGTPVILTDDPAARERFAPMALFTHNDAASIAASMDEALDHAPALRAAAHSYRDTYRSWWQTRAGDLLTRLGLDASTANETQDEWRV